MYMYSSSLSPPGLFGVIHKLQASFSSKHNEDNVGTLRCVQNVKILNSRLRAVEERLFAPSLSNEGVVAKADRRL